MKKAYITKIKSRIMVPSYYNVIITHEDGYHEEREFTCETFVDVFDEIKDIYKGESNCKAKSILIEVKN